MTPPALLDGSTLAEVIARIDAANAEDPNELVIDGRRGPKELLHAERMTEWVTRLDPDADAAQLVAARAHHLRRWEHPRSDYPEGRSGYLRWRTAAKKAHATDVAGILEGHGAPPPFVERVQSIVRKEARSTDPAVQTHEDALCLVFLETQLDDLIEDLGDERAVEVLRRTAAKMSEKGLHAASSLELSAHGAALLVAALAPDGEDAPHPP